MVGCSKTDNCFPNSWYDRMTPSIILILLGRVEHEPKLNPAAETLESGNNPSRACMADMDQ